MRRTQMYIGGQDVAPSSGDYIERICPANGQPVAEFADGTQTEMTDAIGAARTAFDNGPWKDLSGSERGEILLKFADLVERDHEKLARIECEEVGKPIRFARGDISSVIARTKYAASLAFSIEGRTVSDADKCGLGLITYEPIGVVGMIIPWNFPANIFVQKVPFALAAGCTAVVKPSEFTSGTAIELAKLLTEAGVPAGVVNVVTGYGATVGPTLTESDEVDMISFTGSTATGRQIATSSAGTLKKVSLELGGKAANIVFDDADLDDALDGVMFGVYFSQGQVCCSGPRLLLHDRIADQFLEKLITRTNRLRVGDPFDPDADIGALIHEEHMQAVLGYIAVGQREGGEVVAGGKRAMEGTMAEGYFVEPTVIDRVGRGTRVFSEEIFGPVLSVTRFGDVDEAITIANDTNYGLANGLWTKNIDKALTVGKALRSGTIYTNTFMAGPVQMPFGGYKESGYGREMGREGLYEFLEVKANYIHIGDRQPSYPHTIGAPQSGNDRKTIAARENCRMALRAARFPSTRPNTQDEQEGYSCSMTVLL